VFRSGNSGFRTITRSRARVFTYLVSSTIRLIPRSPVRTCGRDWRRLTSESVKRPLSAVSHSPHTEEFCSKDTETRYPRFRTRTGVRRINMSRTEVTKNEIIGLDVGTSRIVSARQINNEIKYKTQLNAFVTIPYSRMTENVLQKEAVPHTVNGDEILVHGDESERFAGLLDKDIRRPMARGVLNPDESENVRLIRQITESLVGKG